MTDCLPKRKKLPHEIPSWVQQGTRHFITINCRSPGNRLCKASNATRLLSSAMRYEELGRWFVWLFLIMPDHLHAILSFDLHRGIQKTVSAWKGYQAKQIGVDWQSGFFEHRLRNQDEFIEKAHYVRMNPVRKGLVIKPEDWPYFTDRKVLPLKTDR